MSRLFRIPATGTSCDGRSRRRGWSAPGPTMVAVRSGDAAEPVDRVLGVLQARAGALAVHLDRLDDLPLRDEPTALLRHARSARLLAEPLELRLADAGPLGEQADEALEPCVLRLEVLEHGLLLPGASEHGDNLSGRRPEEPSTKVSGTQQRPAP